MRLDRIILLFLFMMLKSFSLTAQETDYKMASLFIYNFGKYIDWPDESRKQEFLIGVYGNDDVKNQLLKTIGTKTMNGTPIVIKQFTNPEEGLNCNMVFVTYPESSKLTSVANVLKDKPVLIVSEKQGLLKKGAGINLFTDDEDAYKTKFEINKKSIELKHLKVAGSLVKLAE